MRKMKIRVVQFLACLTVVATATVLSQHVEPVAAGGTDSGYRVLKPIQSGDLTLFPVVRADAKSLPTNEFLTLDEGFKTG